jgi:hypothetical protein
MFKMFSLLHHHFERRSYMTIFGIYPYHGLREAVRW